MEYLCTQCGQRFEDQSAAVRCPTCRSFLVEPQTQTPTAVSEQGTNPYASPRESSAPSMLPDPLVYHYALARVSSPARALVIASIVAAALQALGLLNQVLKDPNQDPQFREAMERLEGSDRAAMVQFVAVARWAALGQALIGLVVAGLVIYGARSMQRLESRGWARAAAILALIPCIYPCCFLGLPLGIWCLAVLADPQVKAAFSR